MFTISLTFTFFVLNSLSLKVRKIGAIFGSQLNQLLFKNDLRIKLLLPRKLNLQKKVFKTAEHSKTQSMELPDYTKLM